MYQLRIFLVEPTIIAGTGRVFLGPVTWSTKGWIMKEPLTTVQDRGLLSSYVTIFRHKINNSNSSIPPKLS